MEIDKAIQNLCKGKTVIVVAHRLSALKMCERVAVVENHTITCVGTHEEVRKNNAYYRKAWEDYETARNITYQLEEASSMSKHDVLKKNRNFYIGVGGTVLEGLLSGSLFMLLYSVMQFLWSGQFDMNRALILTGVIAVIFLFRILIYSYGYTKAQIGGAEVSKNIRLFMGDHLKRIPLSRFTQGQTGDYINTITSDVNNYEKILTHKIGDYGKEFCTFAHADYFCDDHLCACRNYPADCRPAFDPWTVAFLPHGAEIRPGEERHLRGERQQHRGVCVWYSNFPGLWRRWFEE